MYRPRLSVLLPLLAYCVLAKVCSYQDSYDLKATWFPWGWTPIYALALFSAATYRSEFWRCAATPLAFALGDFVILALGRPVEDAFQWLPTTLNYAGMVAIMLCGLMIRRRQDWGLVAGSGFAGATLFYLLTNFGAWWYDPQMALPVGYSRDLLGLLHSYWLGLPFATSLFGSMLLFSVAFFHPVGKSLLAVLETPETQPTGVLAEARDQQAL